MRSALVLLALAVALGFDQQSPGQTAAQTQPAVSRMNLHEATARLEAELKSSGLDIPEGTSATKGIDEDIPVAADPPLPPEPDPEPDDPVGPSPFMRNDALEQFRQATEAFRRAVEEKRERGDLGMSTYHQMIGEYKRRIDLYQTATKLVEQKGHQ